MLPKPSSTDDRRSTPPPHTPSPPKVDLAARLSRRRTLRAGDPPPTAQERPPKRPVIPRAVDDQVIVTAQFFAGREVGTSTDLAHLVARLEAELPPIDLSTDALISPAEVVALLPPRRRGRKAHKSTVFRWFAAGYKGLRLPFLQVGNQRCTSLRALQAFLEALTVIARYERGDSAPACAPPSGPSIDRPIPATQRHLRVEDDLHRRYGL